jgi:hypothetical protein
LESSTDFGPFNDAGRGGGNSAGWENFAAKPKSAKPGLRVGFRDELDLFAEFSQNQSNPDCGKLDPVTVCLR